MLRTPGPALARRPASERGSLAPLLALVVVLAGALVVGLLRLGGDAVAHARARTAADAAALAAAAEGPGAARELAAGNGGEVRRVEVAGAEVEVTVRVGGVEATARARRLHGAGGWMGAAERPAWRNLAPALRAALARAEAELGRRVPIVSGWRSPATQRRLWARRHRNPYPVARPGTSRHEQGLAVDVPVGFAPVLARVGPRVGLCRPWPRSDPVHFELCRRSPASR